jgi:predicted ArsR family transcriptional regulator
MWTAFGEAGDVNSVPARGRSADSAAFFEDEGERRALLLRMGTGPTAWAYLDTLARAARMSRKALRPKLEALEQEGLAASTSAPAGLRYRLTDEGRRLRAG